MSSRKIEEEEENFELKTVQCFLMFPLISPIDQLGHPYSYPAGQTRQEDDPEAARERMS